MSPESPRLRALRMLLMMDATVLVVLGAALVLAPRGVEQAFHFKEMPTGVTYLIGLWGVMMATLGIGYGFAAFDPASSGVWVIVGIARGALESVFGAVCVARGVVAWEQAGFGIILTAFIALSFAVLYPRKESS